MGEVDAKTEVYRGINALRLEVHPDIANDLGRLVFDALEQAGRQAIVDFIDRQSVVYKRHSSLAILEDIELACTEFGCTMDDFYS